MSEIPPMSKKQAQFFAGLIIICTITAALVLVIDYQIKGAILEQANRLRLEIEGWQRGQNPAAASGNRSDSDAGNDVSYPSDLVDSGTTRVETSSPHSASNGQGKTQEIRTTKPGRNTRRSPIQGTGEQV